MLKLFNTLDKKTEEFKPINEIVRIYTCGPTVYGFQHIGNYASYIYWDLLIRTLLLNGFRVKRVLNLTDVGHLTSDGDEGEDKLEKGAEREGKSVYEIAEFYSKDFLRNFRALGLVEPDVIAKATDYIEDDMKAVDKMTENGFTYETTDGIYFDTAKFAGYGDFARLDLEGLKAGARVGFSDEKKNVTDFAVWKFIKPGEKHAMRWDYLGRPGYPGWHLECSTIIDKELGSPIDIHTGGIDHIPVHHTNEIAQTYAMTGRSLAKYWLHCNFITIDGEKISKSLGNIYTLDDLEKRGFSAMDYKMWVLSGHYQGTRNFTFESLEAAKNRRLNWRNRIALLYQRVTSTGDVAKSHNSLGGSCRASSPKILPSANILGVPLCAPPPDDTFNKILSAVNNNLNSAEAFAVIDTSGLTMGDWEKVDELFGLNLIADTPDISEKSYALIKEREVARKDKNFARSDEIRDELIREGITVKDTPDGPIWQYI